MHLQAVLPDGLPTPERIVLHYLDGQVEAELFMPEAVYKQTAKMDQLRQALDLLVRDDPLFRLIRLEKTAH